MSEKVLGEKIFSLKDQSDFAKISGDINPIHLDSIVSRKSIAGECIVHGINSFLWALEFLLKNNKSIHTSYSINFKNKIPLNQKILFLLDENNKQILIKNRFNKIPNFFLVVYASGMWDKLM